MGNNLPIKRISEFSEQEIIDNADWLDWDTVSEFAPLSSYSNDFIQDFKGELYWDIVSQRNDLSKEFIKNNENKIEWGLLCQIQYPEEIWRFFKNNVHWQIIVAKQKLTEEFLREFKDHLRWDYVSGCQKLSESFIEEFSKEVYWDIISFTQELSQDFMRRNKDKISWMYASRVQYFSEEFLIEFKDMIDWNKFFYNSKIDRETRQKLKKQYKM